MLLPCNWCNTSQIIQGSKTGGNKNAFLEQHEDETLYIDRGFMDI